MNCPRCNTPSLVETLGKNGVLVDVCNRCQGLWLDRGEIYLFSRDPRRLEAALSGTAPDRTLSDHHCPSCDAAMYVTEFMNPGSKIDHCPQCDGYWLDPGSLCSRASDDQDLFEFEPAHFGHDPAVPTGGGSTVLDDRVHARIRDLASGMLPLPNLWIRSAGVVVLLYALLGLILVGLAELHIVPPGVAIAIGLAIIVLQFAFGPWLMDLTLRWLFKVSWVRPDQLPEHLRTFLARVCAEQRMKVPSIGLIHDGAPNAFTYGHCPSNMRVVVTQGILDLLEPEEVEAVVAHELGHGKHWDMLLMTIVQLVPLLLYYAYRTCLQQDKAGPYRFAVAAGSYVLYIASQYIVLWFSRCREYHADRFAGDVTGNPNAVAAALVKIGYGLAASGKPPEEPPVEAGKKKNKKTAARPSLDALGALGIFDRKAAVTMAASAMTCAGAQAVPTIGKENLKSAMQWDLWNPWARFYELNSTHPLIARRLQYLGDQAAVMGQEPFAVFDRRRPESYWDDFAVDLVVLFLPLILMAVGLAVAWGLTGFSMPIAAARGPWALVVGLPMIGLGIGSFWKTVLTYRGGFFAPLRVAGLLHKVKVSAIRPVPARLKGTIIGRGVPGLIWSEDFVMRDETGILFLDYRQPLRLWEWLFGLLRAGKYAGKAVEVVGWFRRSPVPYLELKSITVDGVVHRSYARHVRYAWAVLLCLSGAALAVWDLVRG